MAPLKTELKTEYTGLKVVSSLIKVVDSIDPIPSQTRTVQAKTSSVHSKVVFTKDSFSFNGYTFKENIDYARGIALPQSRQKPYKCLRCDKPFKIGALLRRHFVSKHIQEKTVKCDGCGKFLKCLETLRVHQKQMHNPNGAMKFECNGCGAGFKTKISALTCAQKHLGIYNYKCDCCSQKFCSKFVLRRHQLVVHGDPEIKRRTCTLCRKTFENIASLKCHVCKSQKKTNHHTYACDICGNHYKGKCSLRAHQKSHTGYQCDLCGKKIRTRAWLKEHMIRHADTRSFSCSTCEKTFNSKKYLITHENTHTKAKRFPCKVCEKSFTQLTSLKIHTRLHTGEKPYVCDVCSEAFICRSRLNKHRQSRHMMC